MIAARSNLILERSMPTLSPLSQGKKLLRKLAKKVVGSPVPKNQFYSYGELTISLPPGHPLPKFQARHPQYDRFLPHLAHYLKPGDLVIDVGANCGDTLAAMYATNPGLSFLCIEPDDGFFSFLQTNARAIETADTQASIQLVQALVGKNVSGVSLQEGRGTKFAVPVSQGTGIQSVSLDKLLSERSEPVRLLKSDVDGFDYDVIDSAIQRLRQNQPILFFECQFDNEKQKVGYERTVTELATLGYCDWILFDNFGEVLLRTDDLGQILHLFQYLWKQNQGLATRTIPYYDLMVAPLKDHELLSQVLHEY